MEVLRAANDGSAIDDITHILNKLPSEVGSAGSCNEEAPGERRINLQFSSERRSDKQTAEDSGFKCSDSRDEKMTDVGSISDEKMREDGGSDLFGSEDIGDADSDIIYLEGFPSLDEIEDDICCDEMEDVIPMKTQKKMKDLNSTMALMRTRGKMLHVNSPSGWK